MYAITSLGGFESPLINGKDDSKDDTSLFGTSGHSRYHTPFVCIFFFIGLDDLLTLAPGMSSGMSFSSEEKAEAVTTNVDLSELIFGEGAVIKWPDPVHSQPDDQVV